MEYVCAWLRCRNSLAVVVSFSSLFIVGDVRAFFPGDLNSGSGRILLVAVVLSESALLPYKDKSARNKKRDVSSSTAPVTCPTES